MVEGIGVVNLLHTNGQDHGFYPIDYRIYDPDGDGKPDAPVPMVLLVHGGPWGRDEYGYSGYDQWLANRGYAGSFAALGYALPPELATRYRCESMLGVDTVPSFRINCTAIGAQSDDGDLSLSSAGVRAPAGKW